MTNPLRDAYLWLRRRFPLKPQHIDRLAEMRRRRFAHVPLTPAERESFRRYWRRMRARESLRGIPRADRRRAIKQWYRAQKHEMPDA